MDLVKKYTSEQLHALKFKFAAELLKNDGDAFRAAFATLPDDTGMAMQISRSFLTDPVVAAEKERLLNSSDAKAFLPTKEKQAKDIYAIATDAKHDAEDRLKAHRLYAEVMGFIEKPSSSGGINVLNQGVMIVKEHGDNEDWEEKTIEQQRKLIEHATPVN